MHLGIFLWILACFCCLASATHNCLVGNLVVTENVITSKSIELKECQGLCRKQTVGFLINALVLFSCEEDMDLTSIHQGLECSSSELESSCFCEEDECNKIDMEENLLIQSSASRNVSDPDTQLKCYVGLITKNGGLNVGAQTLCDGNCAAVATVIGSDFVTAYHCAPKSICRYLGLDNSNTTFYFDRDINVGCCDVYDNCNLIGSGINITNIPPVVTESPRACYSGILVGSKLVTEGGWTACKGDCVSAFLNTTYNGEATTVSIYTCDPSLICTATNLINRCHIQEPGFQTCCCDSDACLDPTVNPPRKPYGDRNLCYVGAYSYDISGNTIFNAGGEQYCQGNCAAITSNLGASNVTIYACVPEYVCKSLRVYDSCQPVSYDDTITGCCCTNGPNCNLNMVTPQPPSQSTRVRPRTEFPISCPAGLIVNGYSQTPMEFAVCAGQCTSMNINFTVNGQLHNSSFYTCDPSSVCNQLGIKNNCAALEPGVSMCCCGSDACLDPNRGKTVPTPPLKCYVGLYSSDVSSLKTGAEQLCDGKCASVNARVANDNVTIFACVPHALCRSLELYDQCAHMEPYYPEFRACCCDNADNCNVALTHLNGFINTTQPLTPLNDAPISCYSGLYINGTAYSSAGWQTCQGECVSVSITSQFNGQVGTAALYTCDPSRVCRNLKMLNNCTTLENGVTGCCCNTNACIDPTVFPARTPGNQLMCYAGISSNYMINGTTLNVGAEIPCNGQCSSLSGIVNGYQVSTYHCVPNSICNSLELYDNCKTVYNDKQVNACCCNNANNCNIANTTIIPPPPPTTADLAITCYTGLYVNGQATTPITLGACQGQCASISLNTTLQGNVTTATFYGCDPTTVCQQLNMNNMCATPEPGVTGCCCNTDVCLDPTKGKTVPSGFRKCFAGIYALGKATGSEIACKGKCASIGATVNNDNVTVFGCVPTQFCRQLELYDTCKKIPVDRDIKGCCCDNYDNCNVDLAGYNGKINTLMPITNLRDYPIACYSGLFVNNQPVSDAGWQACQGECASATISTMYNGALTSATIYTCDPVSTCYQLGLNNNCTSIEPGFTGCCCSTNACLDPTVSPPRTPVPLKCYVGVKSTYNSLSLGTETYCDGQCASLTGIAGGYNVTTYHCVADVICKTLQIKDTCNKLWNDRDLTACCCNNADNCNVKDPSIIIGSPVDQGFPTACYQGLIIDGNQIVTPVIQGCYGDCASITISTSVQGANHTATLYTCDPTLVCQQLNMSNACHTIEPGVSGCCCDTDGCLNPYTNTWPGPLNCYVGIYTSDGKVNTGATVPCDGYCGSLETTVNKVLYKSYHCVPKPICKALGLNNQRKTISTDKDITGYCCTTGSNCNVVEAAVNTTNVVTPQATSPIACRTSIHLNGVPVTDDSFSVCFGQCASVSYSTQYNGAENVLTLYTCDPTAVCDSLYLSDSCASIDGGLSGCCCKTDNCIGTNEITTLSTPPKLLTTNTSPSASTTPQTQSTTPPKISTTTSSGLTSVSNGPTTPPTVPTTSPSAFTTPQTESTTPSKISTITSTESTYVSNGLTTPSSVPTISSTSSSASTTLQTESTPPSKILSTTSSGHGFSLTYYIPSWFAAIFFVTVF